MILKITLDLPEDDAYLRMTRDLGRAMLGSIQATKVDIDDVDTIVSELYSNVLRHGRSEGGLFQIILEYYSDRVVVYVTDRGKGFSFRDVPPVGATRPDFEGQERIGGYGLQLVRALASRLDFYRYDGDGTTVRAEICLHYITPEAETQAERLDGRVGSTATVARWSVERQATCAELPILQP